MSSGPRDLLDVGCPRALPHPGKGGHPQTGGVDARGWTNDRRLVVDWTSYLPIPSARIRCRLKRHQVADPTFEGGVRVLLAGDSFADVPAVILDRDGAEVTVFVLHGPGGGVAVDLNSRDDTDLPWLFVDEHPWPDLVAPGAVLRAGDGAAVRAWVEVVDLVQEDTGLIAHVRPLPMLVVDDSLPPHPMGLAAWSTSDGNNGRGLAHPLPVGARVAERGMNDAPGTELPAQVASVTKDADSVGWVYRVIPTLEEARVEQLTAQMTGRWEVRTRSARHVWDLDALTYTRLPGERSTAMAHDGQPMTITRVGRWPAVGGQSLVFFDEPTDPTLEHWRICSTIRTIASLPPLASGTGSTTLAAPGGMDLSSSGNS